MKSTSMSNRSALDIANIVAGVGLLLSPWFLGYADQTAPAWNAWIVGLAIAVIAGAALFAFNKVEEWINLVLGVWAARSWERSLVTLVTLVGVWAIFRGVNEIFAGFTARSVGKEADQLADQLAA